MQRQNGGGREVSMTLKQDGDKLSGEYVSQQYGKFPLTGTVTGTVLEDASNQPMPSVQVFLPGLSLGSRNSAFSLLRAK